MKQYDSYKDSGVEWIGKVPIHWEVCKIKHLAKVFGRIGFRGYNQTDLVSEGEGAITLSPSNMQNGKMNYDKCSYLSWYKYNESPEIMIENGDILFVKTGSTFGKVSYVDHLPMEATINPQIVVFKHVKGNNKYLFYMLSNELVQGQVSLTVGGSTIPTLSQESILNYIIPVAPLKEQIVIANYLDKKCSEIDKVISAQQKRIALLQELKQSVITHAVTKGLNPNVEMKDSGVEWIGEVPITWEVMKTSLAFKGIGSGTTPSTSKKEYYDEDGKYWLQTGDLNDGIILDTSKKVSDIAIKVCNLKFYPKDSVVIAMYGATIGKVGILGIKTATNQACCVLPANKHMIAKYSFYEFLACKPALLVSAIGGGQPNISQDTIRKQKIAVPPIEDQKSIADYLDKKCASIDSSISKAQHQVELLQEYKQSLITEVVTGKRKVS